MSYVFRTRKEDVVSLGDYKPYNIHRAEGGDFTNYPAHSGRILDVKDNKIAGIRFFADMLNPELHDGISIAVVPSHDPTKTGGGLHALAGLLTTGSRIDASAALVRSMLIDKLAKGGNRAIDVHRDSMKVALPHLIRGRHVLLLDDVQRTGNSLRAGKEILLASGAASVHCACLGKTW